ncbi:hypothetical protein C475_18511 [Halosimplex carlsbadense 2-9-1]|uniref:Uncharacterized protein n=1 Tax=Halosimplex carlsbadense 2-9-1 TaxID=797114 RepID=M0CHC5_9EURY|nr:hypothetical protein [Halosimplex carlsbadense]ELZ21767.1 hypothetical protein C475_18511 [Halosimplex carlsbadense 2-9-1]
MSTHATPETRDAPTAESPTDETTTGRERDADEPAPIEPFDAHDAAATFGSSTERLPNTVDAENKYLG